MTPKAEVQRRMRERRKAGVATVTITDDRRPGGVYRGEVSTAEARKIIEMMERRKEKDDGPELAPKA